MTDIERVMPGMKYARTYVRIYDEYVRGHEDLIGERGTLRNVHP